MEVLVRFLRPWRGRDAGLEVRLHRGLAEDLERMGFLEILSEQPPAEKKRKR